MRLAETQRTLYGLITGKRKPSRRAAQALVVRRGRLSPSRRIAIYGDQYPARMHESLSHDFPKVAALLGEDFLELVHAYARAFPSEHPDLGQFGRKLERFLRTHAHDRARPDLADLAALEWARVRCFLERDEPPLSRRAFRLASGRGFDRARLRLVSAVRVLTLSHDVLPLWRALDEGRRPPRVKRATRYAKVWRKGWEVFHASASAEEALALGRAQKGERVVRVLEPFQSAADPQRAAFSAFSSWVDEGLVAAVSGGDAPP